jgi:hypothetical protein
MLQCRYNSHWSSTGKSPETQVLGGWDEDDSASSWGCVTRFQTQVPHSHRHTKSFWKVGYTIPLVREVTAWSASLMLVNWANMTSGILEPGQKPCYGVSVWS